MPKPPDGILVWLRRDLRSDDHAALSQALRSACRVWCVFVFDTAILAPLPRADRRVGSGSSTAAWWRWTRTCGRWAAA